MQTNFSTFLAGLDHPSWHPLGGRHGSAKTTDEENSHLTKGCVCAITPVFEVPR